jgi:uncharacterized protein
LIIDGDTHVSLAGGGFSLENQLAALDRARVDRALVWLSPHHYQGREIADHNAFIARAARQHPDRLIPFGWADPRNGVEHAREMVRRSAEEWGFLGVKLNGAQNDFFIDDPETALPVAEEIARRGLMIAFHIGPDAYEKTHPTRAARVARLYPEMPVLMIHMGMTSREMNRAVFEAAEECPNMVLIASATGDVETLAAIRRLGAHRVCFGSDWPFRRIHVIRAMFEAALTDEITAEEMSLFMGGNLRTLLRAR